jgi:predicted transcriptional regulator
MSTLAKLFGSKFLVRIWKLFILNPEKNFSVSEIQKKIRGKNSVVLPAVKRLFSVKFLTARTVKSQKRYQLNPNFLYLPEIKKLVMKEVPLSDNTVSDAVKKIKEVRFAAVGGVLVGDRKGSVDLLAVSDKLNRARFKKIIQALEAEIGREVNFTLMDEKEFAYRFDLYDKFIMDMLEEPNVVVVDKLKISGKEKDITREI